MTTLETTMNAFQGDVIIYPDGAALLTPYDSNLPSAGGPTLVAAFERLHQKIEKNKSLGVNEWTK